MKNRSKMFVLTLTVLLLMIAVVGVLVACDPADETELQGETLSAVVSRSQFDALTNFVYSAVMSSGGEASLELTYDSPDSCASATPLDGVTLPKDGFALATIAYDSGECFSFDGTSVGLENSAYVCFFASAKIAQDNFDMVRYAFEGGGVDYRFHYASRVGNAVIAQTEEGFYENTVLRSTLPSGVSNIQKQLLSNAYDKMLTSYRTSGTLTRTASSSAEQSVDMDFDFAPAQGNRDVNIGFKNYTSQNEKDVRDEQARFDGDPTFTDQSYFNIDEQARFAYYYKQKQVGFGYEMIESGDNAGSWRITDYYNDGEVLESLTIPSDHLYGKVVEVGSLTVSAKRVTIPEGILRVDRLQDDILERLSIPSTLTRLALYSKSITSISFSTSMRWLDLQCSSLAYIYYDGSSNQFNNTFASSTYRWTTVYETDSETGETVEKDIDITVSCRNGYMYL